MGNYNVTAGDTMTKIAQQAKAADPDLKSYSNLAIAKSIYALNGKEGQDINRINVGDSFKIDGDAIEAQLKGSKKIEGKSTKVPKADVTAPVHTDKIKKEINRTEDVKDVEDIEGVKGTEGVKIENPANRKERTDAIIGKDGIMSPSSHIAILNAEREGRNYFTVYNLKTGTTEKIPFIIDDGGPSQEQPKVPQESKGIIDSVIDTFTGWFS